MLDGTNRLRNHPFGYSSVWGKTLPSRASLEAGGSLEIGKQKSGVCHTGPPTEGILDMMERVQRRVPAALAEWETAGMVITNIKRREIVLLKFHEQNPGSGQQGGVAVAGSGNNMGLQKDYAF